MAASEDQNIQTNPQDDSELEQYGVWVKAGPEDVDDGDDDDAFGLADLAEDELESEDDLLSVGAESDGLEVDMPPADFSDDLTLDEADTISLDIPEEADALVADEPAPATDDMELETLELDDDLPKREGPSYRGARCEHESCRYR